MSRVTLDGNDADAFFLETLLLAERYMAPEKLPNDMQREAMLRKCIFSENCDERYFVSSPELNLFLLIMPFVHKFPGLMMDVINDRRFSMPPECDILQSKPPEKHFEQVPMSLLVALLQHPLVTRDGLEDAVASIFNNYYALWPKNFCSEMTKYNVHVLCSARKKLIFPD